MGLAKKVKEITSSKSNIVLVPYEKATQEGFEDMQRRIPDVTKLQGLLNWNPTISLEQTIFDIIEQLKIEGFSDTISERSTSGAVIVG